MADHEHDGNCCKQGDAGASKEGGIFNATQQGDLKTCRELVSQYGIKVINQHDSHGHTPMHWAALGGHTEIIKFFINCGADINRQSKTDYGPFPIHWACVSGHVLAVDLLLQNGASIDVADNKGCTPLIIAAQYGKTMLAGYLIGKGSKVFLTDSEGDTALHWACFKGHSELVQLLLYSGFDAKQKDRFGQTPLHLAALSGDLTTVEHIVDMDVVLDAPDSNNKTPLLLAIGRDHKDVVHFLQNKINRIWNCKLTDIVFGPPGRSKGPILFLLANLFLWGYPVYFYYVLPDTWEFASGAHYLFALTNLFMWVSLYYANARDPGFLPCNTPEYDMALKQVQFYGEWQAQSGQNPLENLCHTCRLVRPLRCKHCRTCNRCVRHFDHHCPYINNCVGLRNRGLFFSFTLFVTLGCYLTLYFCVVMLRMRGFSWIFLAALLEFIVVGLLMTALTIFQVSGICSNLTTNEKINRKRYKYLRGPSGIFLNPFDRGCVKNSLEYFHWIDPPEKKSRTHMFNV